VLSRTGRTITSRDPATKARGSRSRTSSSGSRGHIEKAGNANTSIPVPPASYSNYFALKSNGAGTGASSKQQSSSNSNSNSNSKESNSSLTSKFAKWSRKVQGNLCGASLGASLPSLEEEEAENHLPLPKAQVANTNAHAHTHHMMERPMPEKASGTSNNNSNSRIKPANSYNNSNTNTNSNTNSSSGSSRKTQEQEFDHDHHTFATATTASATISYSTDQGDNSDASEAGMEVVMSEHDHDSADMEDVVAVTTTTTTSTTCANNGPYQSHSFQGGKHTFTVDKRYSLIRVIGSGAYGVVISANDTKTDTNVAIKMVPKCFSDEIDAKRILREIKLLKHFHHDNIVQIMDMMPPNVKRLEDFTDVYIVADLMETDLHRIIYSKQKLSMDHVQYFVYQVMRGLKYIHSCKVLHRDLKPSNLLVNANCDLKICDFGLARGIREKDEEGQGGTMLLTEYVVTRWYRAPEIMLACHEYSYPIDVWSVGCIFAELIQRKPFFPGDDYIDQVRFFLPLSLSFPPSFPPSLSL
jgi:tRNA A-37 threonylcarbamoyl transferase component Bud32